MKKTTAILLSAFILMSVIFNAFASNITNKVYAETVSVEAGEQVTIPIKIENNDGFMGFSIIVTYDADVFTPISVSKGSMLTGMFNDSIATSTDNSFKVVFTGTSDVMADGTMFNIVFNVAENASGKHNIELTYSQQDTFKEGWDNAVLNCKSVEVTVTVNGTTAPPVTTTEPITDNSQPSVKPGGDVTDKPVTEPSTDPSDSSDADKPLSIRMREWVNALPLPFNIILGIFIIPLALIISIFE